MRLSLLAIVALMISALGSCSSGVDGEVDCNKDGPVLTLSGSPTDCESNGYIDVFVEGGEGNITYNILPNPGVSLVNGRYDNIPPNAYTVFATDENGCRSSAAVDIGLVSFEDRVYFIFYMSCTYSGCHNAGTEGLVNYRLFDNIKSKAATITERVVKREMPPAGATPISEADIMAIQCWVNQGAQFN